MKQHNKPHQPPFVDAATHHDAKEMVILCLGRDISNIATIEKKQFKRHLLTVYGSMLTRDMRAALALTRWQMYSRSQYAYGAGVRPQTEAAAFSHVAM